MNQSQTGPLSQMKVVDLSQQLPGPYATQLLASLGATVVKVEPPGGEAGRHLDPAMFDNVNRGKESIALDLKSDEGKSTLHDLVAKSDVFVEGFRPGVALRLGCDFETLKKLKPTLIYCSISGFGQTGPLATRPTHDISLQSMVGSNHSGALIDRIGVPWVDLATGTSAALAITALWHQGEGGYLDLSMLDAALAWSRVKPDAINSTEPTYGTFRTLDGSVVVVAILEDSMWSRLCTALQWEDWASEERFRTYLQRKKFSDEIRSRLLETLAEKSIEDVLRLAVDFDLPIEIANSRGEEFEDQVKLRNTAHPCLPIPENIQQRLGRTPTLNENNL